MNNIVRFVYMVTLFWLGSVTIKAETIPKKEVRRERSNSFFQQVMGEATSSQYLPENAFVLRLHEAITTLIKNNPEIQVAVDEWRGSKKRTRAAWWEFEPDFVAKYSNKKSGANAHPVKELEEGWQAGIEGTLFTGTRYTVEHSQKSIQYNKNRANKPAVFTGATITQPLLKGVWFGASFSNISIANSDEKIALQRIRSALMAKIAEFEVVYWNLLFAQESYRFASRSVEIAEEIVAETKLWLKVGKISRLDAIEASASLAERKTLLFDSDVRLQEAVKSMKVLLAMDTLQNQTVWIDDTLMIDSLSGADLFSNDSAIHHLFERQPDRLVKYYELEREKHILSYHKDQILPELNIIGSWGLTGDGKTLDQALQEYGDTKRQNRSFSAGVELRIPLGGSGQARNLYLAEKEKVHVAKRSLIAVERELREQALLLIGNLGNLAQNVLNIESVLDFRQKLIDAELIRLHSGKSNMRLLFDMEADLLKAQQWRLESLLHYKTAQIRLTHMVGNILEEHHLETVVDGEPQLNMKQFIAR